MKKSLTIGLFVMAGVLLVSGCVEQSSEPRIRMGPVKIKLTEISTISSLVEQGSTIFLRYSLYNGYTEYEMNCSGNLDLTTVCECKTEDNCNEKCLKVEADKQKDILIEPLVSKELNYPLQIPDYEGKLNFTSKVLGTLTIECKGPCLENRLPSCLPWEKLEPIEIEAVIRSD